MSDNATFDHIRTCARCGMRYDWRRSASASLKMTFCGSLCERGALGFTIEALLESGAPRRPATAADLRNTWLIAA